MGKTRVLFKKIRDTKGTFHAKMGTIKDRNGMDLTEAKILRRGGKNTQKNYRKASLSLLAILWNSTFRWVYLYFSPLPSASPHFSAVCKASLDNHFALLHLCFLWMVLVTASCTML